jgi:valyl-tRNA synthetase
MDKWILSRLANAIEECHQGFTTYDFSRATNAIHAFWLYDFCDVYLEAIKPVTREASYTEENREAVKQTIYTCLEEGLRLLHPFMPFLSEELWQRLPRRASHTWPSICLAAYPTTVAGRAAAELEKDFAAVMEIVHAVRALRTEYGVVRKIAPPLVINVHGDAHQSSYFCVAVMFPSIGTRSLIFVSWFVSHSVVQGMGLGNQHPVIQLGG